MKIRVTGAKKPSQLFRFIAITTTVTGLVAVSLTVIVRFYDIDRAHADAERARILLERTKKEEVRSSARPLKIPPMQSSPRPEPVKNTPAQSTPPLTDTIAVPSKPDNPAPPQEKPALVPKKEQRYPSIAGIWQEGPRENNIVVFITQSEDSFTATCTYQYKELGEIRWRMNGTITQEGKISGHLIHTKAPRDWSTQTRTGVLSERNRMITGYAKYQGGGHVFEWVYISP